MAWHGIASPDRIRPARSHAKSPIRWLGKGGAANWVDGRSTCVCDARHGLSLGPSTAECPHRCVLAANVLCGSSASCLPELRGRPTARGSHYLRTPSHALHAPRGRERERESAADELCTQSRSVSSAVLRAAHVPTMMGGRGATAVCVCECVRACVRAPHGNECCCCCCVVCTVRFTTNNAPHHYAVVI